MGDSIPVTPLGEIDEARCLPPVALSIVTPSYNQERFLESAIRSVLDQASPNLEYLVIERKHTADQAQ